MVIVKRGPSTQRAVVQPPRRPTAKSTRPQGPTPSRKVRNVRSHNRFSFNYNCSPHCHVACAVYFSYRGSIHYAKIGLLICIVSLYHDFRVSGMYAAFFGLIGSLVLAFKQSEYKKIVKYDLSRNRHYLLSAFLLVFA